MWAKWHTLVLLLLGVLLVTEYSWNTNSITQSDLQMVDTTSTTSTEVMNSNEEEGNNGDDDRVRFSVQKASKI